MRTNKWIKVVALLLVFALSASLIPAVRAAAAETEPETETETEIITIRTAEDLVALAENCTLDTWSQGKTVSLEADISLEDVDFTAIPTFGGTFQGNGHTISGGKITKGMTPAGLFAVVQETGVVRDLKVSGTVAPSGDGNSVGGVAGENYGLILGCSFTGTVRGGANVGGIAGINAASGEIFNCSASGSVTGSKMTGGIAGCSLGAVGSCRNNAYVNTSSVDPTVNPMDIDLSLTMDMSRLSSADTSLTSSDSGGIVGYSSGVVANCVNSAPVGYPHIGYNVGGIVGRSCGYILVCENRANVYGRKDVGGVAGQMEPYIAKNISESALQTLKQQLKDLDRLLNLALDDVNSGVGTVTDRLNRIADYLDSAAGAASNIRVQGSIDSAVNGGGIAGGGGSVTVTTPQIEIGGSGVTVGGGGSVTVSGGEASGSGGTAAGADLLGPIVSAGAAGSAEAEGSGGTGSVLGGGVASEGALHAGLTEGGIDGGGLGFADGGVNAATQLNLTTSLGGLSSAIYGMSGQMRLLNGEISGISGDLNDDIKAIQAKIDAITDTFMDLFTDDGEDGDVLIDSSETDVDLVTLGKVSQCRNSGGVQGDINVGGVTGVMAMEYELDPEDDLNTGMTGTQRRKFEVKAIIQKCVNTGDIVSKRNYAGGICGKMDLGLIAQSENYGTVTSESGSYVGGIAGVTSSTIRHCFVKCTLSGRNNVGGIVGSGITEDLSGGSSTVAGCCSMVAVEDCEDFAGAISGVDAGTFLENYFVSDHLAGINGRSYSGKAEPVAYDDLVNQKLAAEMEPEEEAAEPEEPAEPEAPAEPAESAETAEPTDDPESSETKAEKEPELEPEPEPEPVTVDPIPIPDEFLQLSLTFVADGETLKTVPLEYGQSFDGDVYPDIPEKEGCYARWDREELQDLHFDTVVTAVYTPYVTALPSDGIRGSGRPIFLIEGAFDDDARAEVTALPNTPDEFDDLMSGWGDYILKSFSHLRVDREIVEQWRLSIPGDGARVHTVRYLPPDAGSDGLRIYVKQKDSWERAEVTEIGTYLTFPVEGLVAEIAVISTVGAWWVWIAVGVLLLALLILLLRLIHKLVLRRREAAAAKAAEEAANAPAMPETGEEKRPETPKKQRRWLMPLLIVLALLLGAGVTAACFLLPDLLTGVKAFDLLKDYSNRQELTMTLTVDAELGGLDLDFTADVDRTDVDGYSVTAISQDGLTLYYCDDTVFLENGSAYKLDASAPDYSTLLEEALELYRHVDMEEKNGVYAITAEDDDARALLELLLPSAASLLRDTGSLKVELVEDGGEAEAIRFSGSGTLGDSARTPFYVAAELTLDQDGRDRLSIPEAVRQAVTSGDYEATEILSEGLLEMASAWQKWYEADALSGKMLLEADCGPVALHESMDYYRWNRSGTAISSIQKNGYAVYFTDTAICTQDGRVLADSEASYVEAARLLDVAYAASLNGQFECRTANGQSVYSLTLDEAGIEAVAYAVAPEVENLDLIFDTGSVELALDGDTIRSISFCCSGSVRVVLSSTDISITAQLVFEDDAGGVTVPEAVESALKQ